MNHYHTSDDYRSFSHPLVINVASRLSDPEEAAEEQRIGFLTNFKPEMRPVYDWLVANYPGPGKLVICDGHGKHSAGMLSLRVEGAARSDAWPAIRRTDFQTRYRKLSNTHLHDRYKHR